MARQGGTLYVAVDSDATSLNPLVAGDAASLRVLTPLYPLLYATHGDLTITPDLAADFPTITDKGATLTVPLRPDAKWSDGMPITADDVVYTVNTETNPHLDTRATFDWSPLMAVSRVDPHTVRFALSHPDATFLANRLVTPIVPQHLFGGIDPSQMSGAPASNQPTVAGGPFRLDHRVAGQTIEMHTNPMYYGGKPHPDQVVFVVVHDPTKLPTQLAEGQVLWEPELATDLVGVVTITSGVTVLSYPLNAFVAVQFNVRGGRPFADAPVRQAFAFSIDHDVTVSQSTGAAQAYPIWSDMYPNSWAYGDNNVTKYARDVAHAKQLLAGRHPAGQLIYPSSDDARTSAATFLAAQAHDTGFALTATGLSDADFAAALGSANFDAALVAVNTSLDPDDSSLLRSTGSRNAGGYANGMVDGLLDSEVAANAASQQAVMQTRAPILAHIAQIVTKDLPLYFLWAPRRFTAFSAILGGVAGAGPQLDHDRANTFYDDWFLTG
jgi:peptide/nickel transport system substrate-binding protein